MSAGQVAALIAAVFFAVGMCAAVFVLLRLGRLISEATRMLGDYRDSAGRLVDRAQEAVDRTNEQLARTDSITASMDEVTANMAELSGHVSALAGLARGISAGLGAPLLRVSALVYGVRRAVGLRRPARVSSATREPGALASQRDEARRALPRQRTESSLSRREEVRR
jgi:ABC-type transporter Mla subunit MlaD